MNALTKADGGALALPDADLIQVLQTSIYPGAAVPSIKMAIAYCKAANLDPLQKPVHIVPMWDSKAGQMRDVIMPGVNLYRTQAARSGTFAGMTEPEFGPEITKTIGGIEVSYPDWCRVTVKRILDNGTIAEFTAREYWMENYAIKGGKEKSVAPNAMWLKRPRGQIAKCAAAQALRIAFPEIASQPTADEMEGKSINPDDLAPPSVDGPSTELLKEATAAAAKGVAGYQAFWAQTGPDNRKALAAHHNALKKQAQDADAARTVDNKVDVDPFVTDMNTAEGEGQ